MPRSVVRDYVRPSSLDDAVQLLQLPNHGIVGGGTDLLLHPRPGVDVLVDLSELGLDTITIDDAGIHIGAMATLTAMLEEPVLGEHCGGVLPEMMVHVGSPLLRNLATIGGHVVRAKLSDVVPVLVALDAQVEVTDGTTRTIPLTEYYADEHHRAPVLLTEILLPHLPGSVGAFRRFAVTAFDLALLNCAVALAAPDGVVTHAKMVFGDAPALYEVADEAAATLVGHPPTSDRLADAAAIAAEDVVVGDDERASAAYRRHLVEVLGRRCLEDATHKLWPV